MGERREFLELSLDELRDVYTRSFKTSAGSRVRAVYGIDDEDCLCDDALWSYWRRAVTGEVSPDALSELVQAVDVYSTASSVIGWWMEMGWLTSAQCEDVYEIFGGRMDYLGRSVRSLRAIQSLSRLNESADPEGYVRGLWRNVLRDRIQWAVIDYARRVPSKYLPLLEFDRQIGLTRHTRHRLREVVRARLACPEP